MKISKQRFLTTVLVGAGVCAVLFAYRSGPSKSNIFEADFEDFATSKVDQSHVPSADKLELAALPPFQSPVADLAVETVTTQAEASIPEMASTPEEPLVVEFEDNGFETSFETNVLEVPSYETNEFETASIETISVETTNDETNRSLPVVKNGHEAKVTPRGTRWKSNPYTRSKVSNSKVEAGNDSFVAEKVTNRFVTEAVTDNTLAIPAIPAEPVESNDFVVPTPIESSVDMSTAPPANHVVQQTPASVQAPVRVPAGLSDAAAQKAVHHIEYGKSLARRSATEAAGQEFMGALRILAESYDAAQGGNHQTRALRSGLVAMKEAADFKVDDPHRQIIMNVGAIIDGHETQVIGQDEASQMTASAATQRYLEYAGAQLGVCGGQNPVAAEALFCLGKMRSISAQANPDPESIEITEAIIFHHASLTADPSNFRSANELGVLLARNGQLDSAELFLKESLKIKQVPQSWANLAKVHQRKGTQQDMQLANLAISEYEASLHREPVGAIRGPIQILDPAEFIARSPMQSPDATLASQPQPTAVVPVSNVEPESTPSIAQRIGSFFTPKGDRR